MAQSATCGPTSTCPKCMLQPRPNHTPAPTGPRLLAPVELGTAPIGKGQFRPYRVCISTFCVLILPEGPEALPLWGSECPECLEHGLGAHLPGKKPEAQAVAEAPLRLCTQYGIEFFQGFIKALSTV